jgi:hypothetical protein
VEHVLDITIKNYIKPDNTEVLEYDEVVTEKLIGLKEESDENSVALNTLNFTGFGVAYLG